MLTVNEIIQLKKEGFTAEEITQLGSIAGPEPASEPIKEPITPENPKPDKPGKEASQDDDKEPPKEPESEAYKALMNKMDELQKQMINSAINSSEQPESESVDKILASIINPPSKKE